MKIEVNTLILFLAWFRAALFFLKERFDESGGLALARQVSKETLNLFGWQLDFFNHLILPQS